MGEFPNRDTQFQPGESGNPNGRPQGTRSLSTIIRDLTENPPDWKLIPIKGAEEMAEKYKNKSAWEAIIFVALGQAMTGDTQAREFLAKRGYGDKLDITSGGEPVKALVEFIGNDKPDTDDQG